MRLSTKTFLSAIAAALSLLASGGCDEVGAATILIAGPPKVPALYELDPKRTTTILVEDGSTGVPISRALRAEIASVAEELLVRKADLEDMISGESALRAASGDRNGQRLSISEIGRSVQADVVIHVFVERLSITPDGSTMQPVVDMDVRVVDTRTGERLWPPAAGPHQVRAVQAAQPMTLPPDGQRVGLQVETAKWAGRVLAELFYKHELASAANKRRL